MTFRRLTVPLLGLAGVVHGDIEVGEKAYQINCVACHQVDTTLVGPSLIAISKTYPEGKREEFINWAVAPGKKNPRMIEMPSMAHVGRENLASIHEYVLEVTKGKKEKKAKPKFKLVPEPKRELPYVRRAHLPFATPSSLAIIFEGEVSACWDTELCRLRYLWDGGKTKVEVFRDVYQLPVEPFHMEEDGPLWLIGEAGEPEYLGYRLVEGQPEIRYRIGEVEICERLMWDTGENALLRRFQVHNPPSTLELELAHEGGGEFSSDKGRLKGDVLSLNAEEARQFTLTLFRK